MAERRRTRDEGETARHRHARDDGRRDRQERSGSHEADSGGAGNGGAAGTDRSAVPARVAVKRATEQVVELIGREPEGVTSVARTPEGWRIGIEVVETRRVPDSTDVLAVYSVDLDGAGELLSYERDQRYYRGRAGKE